MTQTERIKQVQIASDIIGEINKNGMPAKAILVSICACWLIILLYTFDASETAYTYLLAVSGFTGAMAWISICWSQYRFRKRIVAEGRLDTLRYKTPFFPYVTLFGIWVEVFCMAVIAFTPELRSTLYAGVPMMVVPMIVYRIHQHRLAHSADALASR